MRLRKRGITWHVTYYEGVGPDRTRIERSTHCTDKKAAEALGRQWERDAADPDHAAQDKATVADALGTLIATRESEARVGRKSDATVDFYRVKSGHVNRIMGAVRLRELRARHVDAFIEQRRNEGAQETTIHKELVALRASLKLAKRANIWRGDPADVCPVGFSPGYVPRTRSLSVAEALAIIRQLPDDRAAAVAFMVATGAEWSAVERAERADVAVDHSCVLIRGKKRITRWRQVPIVTPLARGVLAFALAKGEGQDGALFTRWPNVRRDIHNACARAGCVRAGFEKPRANCKR